MENMVFLLESLKEQKWINDKFYQVMKSFYESYSQAIVNLPNYEKNLERFELLMMLAVEQAKRPHLFSIFHRALRKPFDYYQFGLDFFRPFIDFDRSQIFGLPSLNKIQEQLKRGENVILLANHQIEPDPQVISLLLEKIDPKLAADMVIFAGHRVVTDPLAIPMSLGRNLLCIHSKKHMSHPPQDKSQKVQHNQRTLKQCQEMLSEGGYCMYVAPSGGRDRSDAKGEFSPAPFDSQSVELFWLISQQAKQLTHFYPLSLRTHRLMPPPQGVEKELGERRTVHFTPVYLAFGEEIDMEHFPGCAGLDKISKRDKRAEFIWEIVCKNYKSFPQ